MLWFFQTCQTSVHIGAFKNHQLCQMWKKRQSPPSVWRAIPVHLSQHVLWSAIREFGGGTVGVPPEFLGSGDGTFLVRHHEVRKSGSRWWANDLEMFEEDCALRRHVTILLVVQTPDQLACALKVTFQLSDLFSAVTDQLLTSRSLGSCSNDLSFVTFV